LVIQAGKGAKKLGLLGEAKKCFLQQMLVVKGRVDGGKKVVVCLGRGRKAGGLVQKWGGSASAKKTTRKDGKL